MYPNLEYLSSATKNGRKKADDGAWGGMLWIRRLLDEGECVLVCLKVFG